MGTAAADSPIIDLTEIADLVRGLEARGAKYIIQSAGNPSLTLALTQPDKRIPDYAYLHFWFQKELRRVLKPETVVIGSAYSLFRDGRNPFRGVKREESSFTYWAAKNIRTGVCDMVALGRQSLADPSVPAEAGDGQGGRDRVVHRLRQLHRVPHPADPGRLRHPRAGVHRGAEGDPARPRES